MVTQRARLSPHHRPFPPNGVIRAFAHTATAACWLSQQPGDCSLFGLTRSISSPGAPHRPPGRARSPHPRPRFSPCASPRITRFPPPQTGPAAFPRFQSLGPQRERRASARRSSASINKQTPRPGSATTPRDGPAALAARARRRRSP